jgi:hypothetical protein
LLPTLIGKQRAVREDRRGDYGERRVLVSALLGNRLQLAVVAYAAMRSM